MVTKEILEELIELDGGIFHSTDQAHRIGWHYKEPSKKEEEETKSTYGVSYWCKFLLDAYAGTSAGRLNKALRKEHQYPLSEFFLKFETGLNHALDEIPSYDYKEVIRWTWFYDDGASILKKYIGGKVMRPDFTSASEYSIPSHSYFFRIKTCQGSNCRDIFKIVQKEGHKLFKSKSVFRIDAFEKDTFYLTEIKSDVWDFELVENWWEL